MITSYVLWILCYSAVVLWLIVPFLVSLITVQFKSGDAWPLVLTGLVTPAAVGALVVVWIMHVAYVLYRVGVHGATYKHMGGHLALLLLVIVAAIGMYVVYNRSQTHIANPNGLGADGLPAIFWTLKQDNEKDVRALVAAGADVNALGYHGATPVIAAAMVEQWLYVNVLLENGAKLDAVDGRGFNLPYLAFNSKIDSTSTEYQNLQVVQQKITAAGLMHWSTYEPGVVRQMVAAGQWPPAMPATDDGSL